MERRQKKDEQSTLHFMQDHPPKGKEGACLAGNLFSADQVVPGWLVKGDTPGRGRDN